MRKLCERHKTCKRHICFDVACGEFKREVKSKTHKIHEVLTKKIRGEAEVSELITKSPLLYRFYLASERLGDDPEFVVEYIIELAKRYGQLKEKKGRKS